MLTLFFYAVFLSVSGLGIYIVSLRLSSLTAILDTVNKKSDKRFKKTCASLSTIPSRTNATIRLSVLRQTERDTWSAADAVPPP